MPVIMTVNKQVKVSETECQIIWQMIEYQINLRTIDKEKLKQLRELQQKFILL